MREKMHLPLKDFLTLVGPAQEIHILEEDSADLLFADKAAKIRDCKELLEREVKFIQPGAITRRNGQPVKNPEESRNHIFIIWVYSE